jgi:hypothetical protein
MMSRYLVHRVETIHYDKEYTEQELVDMGVPRAVFTDGDVTADFMDAIAADDAVWDALVEDTERHGDVQGSDIRIKRAP